MISIKTEVTLMRRNQEIMDIKPLINKKITKGKINIMKNMTNLLNVRNVSNLIFKLYRY